MISENMLNSVKGGGQNYISRQDVHACDTELGIYTSGEYLKNNPKWHIEDSPWKAKQVLKIMERNGLNPTSISEIGCGVGEILHQLYLQMADNASFVGYEIAPDAFQLCQQRTQDRLSFKLGDMLQDDVFFDVTMALDVVEHIEDYFGFLRNLRKKATYKIFHIPLDMSVLKVLLSSYIIKHRKQFGHIQYFTKETALATLNECGYEIIDHFITASTFDVPAKTIELLIARLPRRIMYTISKDMAAHILGGCSLMVLAK